ncbi:MAG: hypothetical protein ABH869_01925 [Candidatus Omnitrophota bacterium]
MIKKINKFWDNYALIHRNWRALLALLLIFIPLLFYALTKEAKLISTRHETAIVQTVKELRIGKDKFYHGYLKLSDGTEIKLSLPPPLPKPGDTVPIIVEYFDNGKKSYSLDHDKMLYGN